MTKAKVSYRPEWLGAVKRVGGGDSSVQKYRAPDGRLRITIDKDEFLKSNGESVKSPLHEEFIYTGQEHVVFNSFQSGSNPGKVQLAREKRNTDDWRAIDESNVATGAFIDGYVEGDERPLGSIVDLARSGKVVAQVASEKVDGIDCQVVDSDGPSGHTRLWIAPGRGNNVIKYTLERPDVPGRPGMKLSFQATAFREVDGRVVISAGHCERSMTGDDGVPWRDTTTVERTAIDLAPDLSDPKLFSLASVPDGLPVVLEDVRSPLQLVWKNGGPVPRVDDQLLADIESSVRAAPVISGSDSRGRKGNAPATRASRDSAESLPQAAAVSGQPEPRTSERTVIIALATTAVLLGGFGIAFAVRRSRLANR